MDAFEDLTGRLVRREGYWVRHSVKVPLTTQDKQALGQPSLPRPELDMVAYLPGDNTVALIECKSFLNSAGVSISAFDGSNPLFAKRFRLFTDSAFQEILTERVTSQLVNERLVQGGVGIEYWLIAGRIAPHSQAPLRELFDSSPSWRLFDATWIQERLLAMRKDPYEDDVVTMAMKLSGG